MNEASWQKHALTNRLQSLLLLGLICGFFAIIGWLLGGAAGSFLMLLLGMLLPGRRNPEPSLLRTHPPTAERVRRLHTLIDKPARVISPWPALKLREPWLVEEALGSAVALPFACRQSNRTNRRLSGH